MPKLPEPGNNPIFPSGTYQVRIISHERTESKEKKSPQIKWKAEIIEPREHTGRTMVTFTVLSSAALWKVSNLIGACGIKFKPGLDTNSKEFDALCEMTYGRRTFWINKEVINNKGNPQNDIVRFEADPHQEVVDFVEDVVPEWLENR